ncbi:MAG: TolC family protein [Alistipes sp.]|nr:TolC family protein [Alistipes sp.]
MRVLFTIIAIALAVDVAAQRSICFDEALALMLANNRALQGARYSADAAEEELRAARGLRSPRIDLIGGYALLQRDVDIDLGGTKGVVTSSIEGLIGDGLKAGYISPDAASFLSGSLAPLTSLDWRYTLQKRSFATVGATLTMPIYMGGRINVANRVARLRLDADVYRLNATENALLTQLVERYYGVVLAEHVVAVRRDVLRGVVKHLDDAIAMEEEGLLAHSAILYVEYRRSTAERDLVEAEHQLEIAKRALANTVNVNGEVLPSGKMFILNGIHSLDYYVDNATNLNPILCGAKTEELLVNEGIKLSRAELLPEIAAMAGGSIYSYNLSGIVPRWALGVGLKMTLFDGLGKERRLHAAKLKAKQVGELVENAQDEILLLVEKEYYTTINSLASVESCRSSMTFAESYLYSMSEGFSEGVTSSAELEDARVEYAAAKVEYLNAAYNFVLSLARLLEAAGLSSEFIFIIDKGMAIDI